jgi:hypothetical protein
VRTGHSEACKPKRIQRKDAKERKVDRLFFANEFLCVLCVFAVKNVFTG